MKVFCKNKHFSLSQFLDLFCAASAAKHNDGVCFVFVFFIFTELETVPSSSKVNLHIPHGCDLWSNETQQNGNVKIVCVRCQERSPLSVTARFTQHLSPNLKIKRCRRRGLSLRRYRLTSTAFGMQRDRRGWRARGGR